MEHASITAGGRRVTLVGRHPAYLRGLDGNDADQGMLARAIAVLPPGSAVFDVGANIGVTAVAAAAQRPDCRVIAFEPTPSNVECLRRNIQANGIDNIEVVEAAVSDAPGMVTMTDNGPWSHASAAGTLRCRSVVLDDYASPEVRFIKIDVEGFEPNVIAGGRRLFGSVRPHVAMEFNTWALLLHHYDPLVFASTLWSCWDVDAVYGAETSYAVPATGPDLVHMNLTEHGCVSDLLLRPRDALPDLATMIEAPGCAPATIIEAPGCARLRAELVAVECSTSWRVMAPFQSVGRLFRARVSRAGRSPAGPR